MAKFCIIFLITVVISLTHGHIQDESPSYNVEEPSDYSTLEYVGVPAEDKDFTELYVSFGNSVFEFLANLVRRKVNLVLLVKRGFVRLFVQGLIQLMSWVQHNGDSFQGAVNTVIEFMKVFMTTVEVNENHVPHY